MTPNASAHAMHSTPSPVESFESESRHGGGEEKALVLYKDLMLEMQRIGG